MNQLEFLLEAARDPEYRLILIGVLIALPPGLLFFFWAGRRKLHPVAVWVVLCLASFFGSQMFRENRSKKLELAISGSVVSAVATLVWFRVFRKRNDTH